MDRTACLDLPAFPLQLLLWRRPDWRTFPAAVVESDRPQAHILWVNERARASGIRPGMRYAAGLSLDGELRAGPVSRAEVRRKVGAIAERLRRYTPGVEPVANDPGAFWLDASGLMPLFDSIDTWAREIRAEIEAFRFAGVLVVGFSRFGTYALAKSWADRSRPSTSASVIRGHTTCFPPRGETASVPGETGTVSPGLRVLDTSQEERTAVREAALDRLAIAPKVIEILRKLGVRTVGKLLALPAEGLEQRFGGEIARLHRFASGAADLPVQPERPPAPAVQCLRLDHPEADRERLGGWIEHLLADLLALLAGRGLAVTQLRLGLACEDGGRIDEALGMASPTLDLEQIRGLLRLRLEALRIPDRVVEIALDADAVAATAEQIGLFAETPRRDLAAAGRALARLRAAFGDDAVVRAALRDAHLPEASFAWEPAEAVAEPHPRVVGGEGLVRRFYERPVALPPRERHEPDGWMLRGLQQGPVVRVLGPYVLSGGWWDRPIHREYHFAETQRGELLWVFYDRPRRRWFLQGRVE